MVPALFVANYIIEYSNQKGYSINNLKLQKLLYFINARSIVENGLSFFSEAMEKWKYGPVVPSVYHEYKRYGAFDISDDEIVREYVEFSSNPFKEWSVLEYDPSELNNRSMIEDTVDKLSEYSAFQLVEETHRHTPWSEHEIEIMDGAQGLRYTAEEIAIYFKNNPKEQLWVHYQ